MGQTPDRGAHWPIPWIQYVADDCRDQAVTSPADLDLERTSLRRRQIATAMLEHL
ncbi:MULTISPECIES: hypothetical protein [Streptosporangium]|uniref:Uncharacterized protein n=1 Tax=Streptosporangium brasiliense TaxID=47480 RepID=A0ABT9RGE6_9ACTN|nr:hypothetical protein [Streptosporangium brasiliense]MDP9867921.1 hypothetical protein [Streptosporangium brasiliense]